MRDLESPDDNNNQVYSVTTTNTTGTMTTTFTYQFCHYTTLEDPETFAYMDQNFIPTDGSAATSTRTILTDNTYALAAESAIIPDGDDYADGISVTHDDGDTCTSSENY